MENLRPNFKREIIKGRQTSRQIALNCKRAVLESEIAAKIIDHNFKDRTIYMTCFNIYNWLRKNIKYVRESDKEQSAKTLQRILFDKFGDCKHYTIFSVSILRSLGIPVKMRLISQNFYDPEPTHIYAVVITKKGEEIIVDPCIRSFNTEAIYKYKYDLNIN